MDSENSIEEIQESFSSTEYTCRTGDPANVESVNRESPSFRLQETPNVSFILPGKAFRSVSTQTLDDGKDLVIQQLSQEVENLKKLLEQSKPPQKTDKDLFEVQSTSSIMIEDDSSEDLDSKPPSSNKKPTHHSQDSSKKSTSADEVRSKPQSKESPLKPPFHKKENWIGLLKDLRQKAEAPVTKSQVSKKSSPVTHKHGSSTSPFKKRNSAGFVSRPKRLTKTVDSKNKPPNRIKLIKKETNTTYENNSIFPSIDRPKSCSAYQKVRSLSGPEKPIGPDWHNSELDKYVNKGELCFNFLKDPNFFTEEEILKLKKRTQNPEVQKKAKNTLERLKQELLIREFYSCQNHSEVVKECKNLLRGWKLTVDILKLVHEREKLIMSSLTQGYDNQEFLDSLKPELKKLNKALFKHLALWDKALPYQKFIYLSEDYVAKITHQDNCI